MSALMQDVRYGLRALRKSPGFAAATIAVLALGIGANSAIFSFVNGILLRPLPYPDSERVMDIAHVPPQDIFPGRKTFSVSPANYIDWRARSQSFEKMAAYAGDYVNVSGTGEPQAVLANVVTSDYFAAFGVAPKLGRGFTAAEEEPGHRVVIVGEAFWKSQLGGAESAVGSTMKINGEAYTIVGILSARMSYPEDARLFLPLQWTPEDKATRGIHDFDVVGRLKPGVSVEKAQAELTAIAAQLAKEYTKDNKGWGAIVRPLREGIVGDVRPALLVLLGAVGFVLAIACANVANLVMAKTVARRKEIALRSALGASRARVLGQILVETLLLSLLGGAAGLVLAHFAIKAIQASIGSELPRAGDIRIDLPVLLFTLAASVVTGVLAGLVPAWRLTRANVNDVLKQGGGRSDADAGGRGARQALVVAEVALALMLMVGAGLLVRSLSRLRTVDPGFEPRGLLNMSLSIPDQRYDTPEKRAAFYDRLLQRVRALPGVDKAGAINTLPLTDGGSTQPIVIDGRPAGQLSEQPEVAVRVMTTGAIGALKFRLLRGRDFREADTQTSPPVVLVSESFAKRFWPGVDPIGHRVELTFRPGVSREVIGVVADVKLRGLDKALGAEALYVPHAQNPNSYMSVVVRTETPPQSLASAVTRALHEVDPEQPIMEIRTMEQHMGESLAHQNFSMRLLSVFAGLALVLAAVGIYSVLAYGVRRRKREIAIRMALGADRGDVLRLIVGQGMRPAGLGLAIGAGGALALGSVLRSLVFGVSARDPLTFGAVAALLAGVALAACALPALRATLVEPSEALQEQ
ncbi:MAG TPA: ABC transporter permease [Thermoanaerobaculia bacterium]|nr:ABC transporter permease [Thermoanaerobaculia bacterium]